MSGILGHRGLLLKPDAGGVWSTSISFTPTSSSAGWSGYTVRHRVTTAQIVATGTKVRVTLRAGSSVMNVGKCYIGLAAASGDPYDYASTPTQIFFGGNPGVSVAANTNVLSDEATFTIDDTTDLILTVYFSGAAAFANRSGQSGWSQYYKSGDDAVTVNASGYSGGSTEAGVFTLVEVQ